MSNFKVFGSTAWARIPLEKRKYLQLQSIECLFIVYLEESKGFKLLNIRTKQIFIERSVCFEESLQEVELVEEKSAEISFYSADHLGDESGSEGSYFEYLIDDISEKKISGIESDSEVQNHILHYHFHHPNDQQNKREFQHIFLQLVLPLGEVLQNRHLSQ